MAEPLIIIAAGVLGAVAATALTPLLQPAARTIPTWLGVFRLAYLRTALGAVFGLAAAAGISLRISDHSHHTVSYLVWYGLAALALVGIVVTTVVIDRKSERPRDEGNAPPPAVLLPDPTERPDRSVGTLTPAPVTPVADRVFVSQTPRELVGLFKHQTAILAQRQADVFYGKWIRLSGRLDTVGAWTGYFSQVTFAQPPGVGTTVFMMFRDREVVENRLSVLRKGAHVTVEGEIERIDSVSVQLTNCELALDGPERVANAAPDARTPAQGEDSQQPIFEKAPPGLADMTEISLRELVASRTKAQADELLKQYRGEPVRVSGEVADVDLTGTPSVQVLSPGIGLRLFFDADDYDARPSLLSLHHGDQIVVSGQIHSFAASTMTGHIGISIGVDKCKLLTTRGGRS